MIGVVVNPVAGIGGPAGLSGSDGAEVQRLAVERGSVSRAQERTAAALRVLAERRPDAVVLAAAGEMGERAVRAAGLEPRVAYRPATPSSAVDTGEAVRAIAAAGADLVLFAGGDGTARDVCGALPDEAAALGIPCGVKMYSGVFAVGPRAAGATAASWCAGTVPTVRRDVLDIDEAELRRHRVAPRLYGAMRVPVLPGRTQARKSASPAGEHDAIRAVARGFSATMLPGVRYALGPGGTMQEVARAIGYRKAPLGVDVVLDGEPVARDLSEPELFESLSSGPSKAVVSVIGGQGFVIGRGNQQFSPRILGSLGTDGLVIVAPDQKLIDLGGRPLLVDTGDPAVDARLTGIVPVITGISTRSLYRMRASDGEE